MTGNKRRIWQLVCDRGFAPDEARARALIMAGRIYSGTLRLDNAGQMVTVDTPIALRPHRYHPFVGRGGLKLAGALDALNLSPDGMVCLDLGAGTGGFTDCLLQRGATKVYAVDVGRAQLDQRLRRDQRVVVLERTHAVALSRALVPDPIDFISADISFNSLVRILKPALLLLNPRGRLLILVKPHFEAPRTAVQPGGVVRDEAVRQSALNRVAKFLESESFQVINILPSPVKLRSGNMEYFIYARYDSIHLD